MSAPAVTAQCLALVLSSYFCGILPSQHALLPRVSTGEDVGI